MALQGINTLIHKEKTETGHNPHPLIVGVGGMRRSLEIRRPLLAGDRAFQTFLQTLPILADLADSKASLGTPPLPPTLALEILFPHLRLDFLDFF